CLHLFQILDSKRMLAIFGGECRKRHVSGQGFRSILEFFRETEVILRCIALSLQLLKGFAPLEDRLSKLGISGVLSNQIRESSNRLLHARFVRSKFLAGVLSMTDPKKKGCALKLEFCQTGQ